MDINSLRSPRSARAEIRESAMTTPAIAILGSGMAALGASHRLRSDGVSSVLYDKNPYHGGHTASHRSADFIFDEGPHVSFTKHERIRQLFAESIDHKYETIHAKINNYWRGYWLKHPAICNLYGLPSDLVVNIVADFVKSQHRLDVPCRNYEDWLVASYGRTYAETFPMQYTRKYHTTTADNMSTDWLGPRLYQAKLEEVLLGALSPVTPNIHYVQEYRYPTHDGFASYLNRFSAQSQIVLNHRLVALDRKTRELHFSNGTVAAYDYLISSVPLPDLISMISETPADVLEAANKLACTSLVLINLGVNRPDISDTSWSYFYEDEYLFSRVSFPRTMSPHTVPPATGSIQAEVYFSRKYRPLERSAVDHIEPAIEGLRRCGLIREEDKILFQDAMVIPYANIIFDLDREASLRTVHGYLDDLGIAYCGRYGEWGYLWTDDAFMSGENAAQKILNRMTSPPPAPGQMTTPRQAT